jgi:hypothetical protein
MTTIWNGIQWSHGLPNLETKAVFAADFISTADLSANEMEVLPDVHVIISNTHTLTVVNDVKSSGTSKISFDATAQFIQKNPTALTPPFEIFRETTPIFRKDYTYFSSPVSGQALNTITAYSLPFDAAFDVGDYNNTNGLPFSGDYNPPLFDKYYQWNASATPVGYDVPVYTTGAWQQIPETTTMSVARGYIVRGPQSFPDFGQGAAQPWWVRFSGVANNGNISIPIVGGSYAPTVGGLTALPSPTTYPYEPCNNIKYNMNLIGNPYP